MRETGLLEAFLQCNNYTQRWVPLGSVKYNDLKREKLFQKVIQRSSSLMWLFPSCPLEKPLSPSVEHIGKVLAYTPEQECLI